MLKDYKELEVWKKAYLLVLDIYKITEKYPKTEVYGLVSQLRRCAVSIPSNIAEGYRRQHKKEYEQFLAIALGSLAEIETQVLLSKDLNLMTKEDFEKVWPKIQEVAKMLSGLKKSIKNLIQKVKMVVVILLFALPATLSPIPSYASGAGTTAANFLKVSMNARAIAMGGAFSALADDSGAVFSNPAGLASFSGRELGFGFTSYLEGSKMGNISYATDVSGNRFGLGITALNISGIEKRGLTDTAGIVSSLGNFDSNDVAVSLAYASKDSFKSILENMDGGFALKFVKSTIDDSSAFAVAIDAGVLYRATEKMNVSLVLQNLGSKMKYEEESDPLPLDLKVGMLYKPGNRLNLTAELNQYFIDEKFYPSFGTEYWFRDAFALRGGYKFGYDTSNLGNEVGLSLGFGVKVADLGMDYAYLPFGDLGNIHRFGFWLQF